MTITQRPSNINLEGAEDETRVLEEPFKMALVGALFGLVLT